MLARVLFHTGLPASTTSPEKFTQKVREGEGRAWETPKLFDGGKRRPIRYKRLALYLGRAALGS